LSLKKSIDFIQKNKEIVLILIISAVIRWINIFQYPSYFVDEELYTTRAWSILQFGSVEIYPLNYDYDHPFLGWLIIAGLFSISPGDLWIEKARFAMIYVSLIQILFLYLIGKKYTSKKGAIISTIVFSFTNSYISLSRMVLLDNIALALLLIAIYSFYLQENKSKTNPKTNNKSKSKINLLSAVFFGLTLLVKETFIFFLPGFFILYLVKVRISTSKKINFTQLDKEDIENLNENENENENINSADTEKKSQKNEITNKTIIISFIKWVSLSFGLFGLWGVYAIITDEFYTDDLSYGLVAKVLAQMSRGLFTPF
jgi:dolichyl-phosphate-mannose-protein mannosyltransferase